MADTLASRESKGCVLWHQILDLECVNHALSELLKEINGENLKMDKSDEVKASRVPIPSLKDILVQGPDVIRNRKEECLKMIESIRELLI